MILLAATTFDPVHTTEQVSPHFSRPVPCTHMPYDDSRTGEREGNGSAHGATLPESDVASDNGGRGDGGRDSAEGEAGGGVAGDDDGTTTCRV